MSYDPACHDLARFFLGERASQKLIAELAQHVQDEVEIWMEMEKRRLEKESGAGGKQ